MSECAELRAELAALRAEVAALKGRFATKQELNALRLELLQTIESKIAELRVFVQNLITAVEAQINNLRQFFLQLIAAIEVKLDNLRQFLLSLISELRQFIQFQLAEIWAILREVQRTIQRFLELLQSLLGGQGLAARVAALERIVDVLSRDLSRAYELISQALLLARRALNRADSAYLLAGDARSIAIDARGTANAAYTRANQALNLANDALSKAIEAGRLGERALNRANDAWSLARSAYDLASDARSIAIDARGTANAAYTRANQALNLANDALSKAIEAGRLGERALNRANDAWRLARSAYDLASNARSIAIDARGTANAAYTRANQALNLANDALSKAIEALLLVRNFDRRITNAQARADQAYQTAVLASGTAAQALFNALRALDLANEALRRSMDPATRAKIDQILKAIGDLGRAIGVADLPAVVPTTLISREGTSDATQNIPSLAQFLAWQTQQFDALMGQWEVPIEVENADGQKQKLRLPNLAEATAEQIGLLMNLTTTADTLLNVGVRALTEAGFAHKESAIAHLYARANAEFLGYEGKETNVKLPMTFKPGGKNLEETLQNTEVSIKGWENIDKQDLRFYFHEFLSAAAIVRAVYWHRLDPKSNLKQQIVDYVKQSDLYQQTSSNDDDKWDDYLGKVEQGFTGEAGISDPANPYGRDPLRRPRIRKLGDQDANSNS